MKIKSVFLLLFVLLMGGCGNMDSVQEQIEEKYTDADGLIHAYPANQESEYLSESIGLYMEYLTLVEDEQRFSKQYEILKNHFLVQQDDFYFIRWRLNEDASTNALIDDIRIISALEQAAENFGNKEYEELAEKLSNSIAAVQLQGNLTVDFYDWSLAMPAQRLTLSYVEGEQTITADSFKLLEDMDADGIFFPEYYDTAARRYSSGNEVHMIDQLLIALNREKRGQDSDKFSTWLQKEWQQHKQVSGRYSRETLERSVDYESLAVYYYLHAYFSVSGESRLADDVVQHAKEIATEETLQEAHFFDYIHYQLLLLKE